MNVQLTNISNYVMQSYQQRPESQRMFPTACGNHKNGSFPTQYYYSIPDTTASNGKSL